MFCNERVHMVNFVENKREMRKAYAMLEIETFLTEYDTPCGDGGGRMIKSELCS